jgi:hypothetical protein
LQRPTHTSYALHCRCNVRTKSREYPVATWAAACTLQPVRAATANTTLHMAMEWRGNTTGSIPFELGFRCPCASQAAYLPTTPPVYSCRSGLSVLMQGTNAQGQAVVLPFSMSISQKSSSEATYHVAILQQRTLQQVCNGISACHVPACAIDNAVLGSSL